MEDLSSFYLFGIFICFSFDILCSLLGLKEVYEKQKKFVLFFFPFPLQERKWLAQEGGKDDNASILSSISFQPIKRSHV